MALRVKTVKGVFVGDDDDQAYSQGIAVFESLKYTKGDFQVISYKVKGQKRNKISVEFYLQGNEDEFKSAVSELFKERFQF